MALKASCGAAAGCAIRTATSSIACRMRPPLGRLGCVVCGFNDIAKCQAGISRQTAERLTAQIAIAASGAGIGVITAGGAAFLLDRVLHDRQRAINSGGGKECMDEVASAWNKRRLGSRIRASSLRRSMCRTTSAFPLTRSRPRRSVMGSLGNAIHSLKPHRDWVLRVNFVLPASAGMAARCTSDLRLWRLPYTWCGVCRRRRRAIIADSWVVTGALSQACSPTTRRSMTRSN